MIDDETCNWFVGVIHGGGVPHTEIWDQGEAILIQISSDQSLSKPSSPHTITLKQAA